MSAGDAFLSRWSRRKRAAVSPPLEGDPPPDAQLQTDPDNEAEDGAEPFDLSLLPDLDALTGESDIQAFLHKAVPEALRNAALRKVWALDPTIRDYVGEALDYAWDFNTPGGVPGFGELPSIEHSTTFVSKMLERPQDHENVIDTLAAQQTDAPPPDAPARATETGGAKPEQDSQVAVGNDVLDKAREREADEERTAPQPRKPRHGGALPC